MSIKVTTWADGFGNWHAEATRKDATGDASEMLIARAAVVTELKARASGREDYSRMTMRRVSRTSRSGVLTTEYIETWEGE